MTQTSEIRTKLDKLVVDMSRFALIVNGGDMEEVATDGGNVPSVANFYRQVDAEVDAQLSALQLSLAAQAAQATTSASDALASAGAAATSASGAGAAQVAAELARDQTLSAFDSFDDRYLGAFLAAPSMDNDGDPLTGGALYFSTADEAMKVYTGTAWAAAYVSGQDVLFSANNLSELGDTALARTNLGLTPRFSGLRTLGGRLYHDIEGSRNATEYFWWEIERGALTTASVDAFGHLILTF